MATVLKANNKGLNDKWVRRIGIPLVAILLLMSSDIIPVVISPKMLIYKIFRNIFYVFCYWESNRMIVLYMRSKYPDLKDTSKRIAMHIVVFVVFVLVAGFLITVINVNLPQTNRDPFLSEYKDMVLRSVLILGLVTVIYECAYYFGLYEQSLYESERLKKESLISQLELLRNQISPHFLFNSLNALITLVPEDPQLSVLFIQRLSNVYRHVLNYNGKNVISLETEKNFLDDYIFLHQMRFGENLMISYHLPEKLDHLQVIPFTLQMLVENAIKHNIISKRKPLAIDIRVTKNFIIVSNNLQRKTSGVESTNTGLRNIVTRYELLTNKIVNILATSTEFTVSLPLIISQE
ncbi:Histidine kinase [Pedobacter westerhofensis]|uniref:Histidine kinase n=1 Tax=Pedobacter westerhofensis TaxID=425512 RepID=A0A521AK80_9SPHI|nr:histidine kinase [Pedobacter westerhofensis]SMO35171.1 Histidine kinase [Pedobacter westerhofensis]